MTSRYGITIPFDGVTLGAHKEWFHRLADLGYTTSGGQVDGRRRLHTPDAGGDLGVAP